MPVGRSPAPEPPAGGTLTAEQALRHMAQSMPADAIIAEEAPSHRNAIQRYVPIRRPGSFFTMASGGLGYGLPAAPGRRAVALIGDGSMMYSIQALYTMAQWRLPVTVVVLKNKGYGAKRAFSQMMGTPGAPGIDLPGLDFTALAAGHGCPGAQVDSLSAFRDAFSRALAEPGPTVIDPRVDASFGALYTARR